MKSLLLLAATAFPLIAADSAGSQEETLARAGWKPLTYKVVGGTDLKLWQKLPPGGVGAGNLPAIVFFFGGGWTSRNLLQFQEKGEGLASLGMQVFLADYRAKKEYGGTPFDCVQDAKSAMRYLRANAAQLGIDPARIAAGGGSAGGHLAAAAALLDGFNEPSDPAVSPVPDALILFNPVYDNGEGGYGYDRVKARWKEFSPLHNIRAGAPPNIVFLGTKDELVPVASAEEWKRRMQDVGVRSELVLYDGRGHGFFNNPKDGKDTLAKTVEFLRSLGYLPDP